MQNDFADRRQFKRRKYEKRRSSENIQRSFRENTKGGRRKLFKYLAKHRKNEPFDLTASRKSDAESISLRSWRVAFVLEHFNHLSRKLRANLKIDFDKLLRYLSHYERRTKRICSGMVSNLVDCVIAISGERLTEKRLPDIFRKSAETWNL